MVSSWLIFLCASAVFVLLGSIAAGLFYLPYRKGETKIRPLYCAIAGVYLSGIMLILPVHLAGATKDFFGLFKTVILTLLNSAKLFTGGDFDLIADGMATCEAHLVGIYQAWAVVVHIVAPALTLSYLATMLKNFVASLRYKCIKTKDVYIFSELNEKSLALAEDIYRKNTASGQIVFTGLQENWEKKLDHWVPKLRKMGAICFRKGLDVLELKKPCLMMSFFLISENRQENLRLAKKLIPEYQSRQAKTRIIVFAESLESELVLSAITPKTSEYLQVKRIQEARTLVNWMLQNRPGRIFDTAVPQPDGTKHIGAVVVGVGSHGTELVKALTWYCQMPGYSVTIDAFDRDPLAEEKFTAIAPELMDPKFNGGQTKGDANYTLRIHAGVDVTSETFFRQVRQIPDVSYIFVNLGSDELNIATGIELWRQAARKYTEPAVDVLVYDGSFTDTLNAYQCKERKFTHRNEKTVNYAGVEVVGNLETAYSCRVILNEELESKVLDINRRYNQMGGYQYSVNDEYGYYSTAASAIHRYAIEHCKISGKTKTEMAELEHIRWNAYMRAEGYHWSGKTTPESRQHIAKTHPDMVPWGELPASEIPKDMAIIGSQE